MGIRRPTLPSLRSLGLLVPSSQSIYDSSSRSDYQWPRTRQISTSSSTTSRSMSPPMFDDVSPSSSCTSSPSVTEPECLPMGTPVLSISPLASKPLSSNATTPPLAAGAPPVRFRLEPCSFDEAQAIVFIPPPLAAPIVPATTTTTTTAPPQQPQPILLLGPSMEHFRHPQRQLAKGARVHPYRIMPSRRTDDASSRRSSTASALFAPL